MTQAALARRARTSQKQISRIERGEVSPSVSTLQRLLAALGEELELGSSAAADLSTPTGDLAADARLSPGERVAQTAALSRTLTSIANARR